MGDNPCARMPCANGGSCQVSHNQGYQCNCKSKFTGRQCQRNRDQCHPNPCQNNGQCIMDDLRGFLCKCGSRYAGRVCQTELYDLMVTDIEKVYNMNSSKKFSSV